MKIRRRSILASTDKDISYRESGGTYYFTTYDVYVGGKLVGKLEHHNRDVKQEYYVAWITKNGNYDPWKGDWETKSFDSEDKAIDWILSSQNNSIDSSCTKKSVKAGYQLQFPYMVEGEFADGYTYTAGGNSEAECVETLANMQDKHGELVWYSGVTDDDYDAGRRVDSACRRKSVKASKRNKRKPIMAATDISNPYIRIFLTNLGKYNEGELVGEWVDLPVDDFDDVLERIGINDQYEEYFITDYETNIPKLSIGEYDDIDELNDMASQIDNLNEWQVLILSARLYNGESFEDALAGCDDGSIYYDCYSDQDLGYEIIDQIGGTEQLDKDTLEMYFDYDGYGRDARINGSFIEVEPGTLVELY